MEWDVFISHASEDKAAVALPLTQRLKAAGLRVWLDKFQLTVGDSLRRSIDEGLSKSRFGIVVLSPAFFQKQWPQAELDGLAAREAEGVKVILPVWHQIDANTIRSYSPMLAGRLGVPTDNGLDHVEQELLHAIRRDNEAPVDSAPAAPHIKAAAVDVSRLCQVAKAFHTERTKQISTGNGPIPVLDGGMLVLHILPYAAVDNVPAAMFDELSRQPNRFRPMKGSVCGVRINYDGMLIGSNANGLGQPQRAYVNILRNGSIEAVMSSLAMGGNVKFIELPHLHALVIRYATDYVTALKDFGVMPPMAVSVSLANAEGVRLLRDFVGTAIPEDIPYELIDRDILTFGPCVLDAVPDHFNITARALKPIVTHLANAAGASSAPYFDADGNCLMNL